MFRKFFRIIPLLLLFGTLIPEADASHMMGVDLTYECINNCTIRVHLRAYRDCSGASGITNSITFNGTAGCTTPPQPIGGWSAQLTTEVTPICPGTPTKCTNSGAAINGVEEYYWWRDYDICSASANCTFSISWGSCCRNGAITSGASNQSMYINTTTINTGLSNCNSSPQFANPPVPYICAGQTYTFNQGAYDPDGDSLVYSLGPCYQSTTGTQVTYGSGYSAAQPLGSSWNVAINSQTGDITVTPQPGNQVVGVMCVYVNEYRNGVLINSIVRDIQMTVISCPNNTQPSSSGAQLVSGGATIGANSFLTCAGTQICIDIPSSDPDAGQQITMFWDQGISGASFVNLANPAQQDSFQAVNPTGRFCWTPPAPGNYTFLVTLQDNACPIYGSSQFTISITVNGGLVNASASATVLSCTDVQFNANAPFGTPPITYQWSGPGNLNANPGNNTSGFAHNYPAPGAYPWQVVITDSFGCTVTITDTVTPVNGTIADAGPDISICSGYSSQLGSAPIAGQTYTWLPTTGMSGAGSTSSNPTITLTAPGPLPDTIYYMVTASDGICSSYDYATVIVYPTPTASINGPTSICIGDTATLTASGGTSYLWSTGDTSQSIQVAPSSQQTYNVTVLSNGCSSLPVSHTVDVITGPNAIVTGTDSVCPGSNALLTAVGGTSYVWSTGSTNQSIVLSNLQTDTTVYVQASNSGCPGPLVPFTVYIKEKPVADFTAPDQCEGTVINFSDGSTIGSGGITNWEWDFADAGSGQNNFSNNQNPGHSFTSSGVYNVNLVVIASNGCRDTVNHPITVFSNPQADFTFQDVCENEEMFFTDASNTQPGGGAITTYNWDFGDGASDNNQNTSHFYNNPNGYQVTLTVTDDNGCTGSRVKTVYTFPNPVADFTYEFKCFNTIVEFHDTSTVVDNFYGTYISYYSWNFADPGSGTNSSNLTDPVHTYATPGVYNVELFVSTTKGCRDSITIPVDVQPTTPIELVGDTVCRDNSAFLQATNSWPGANIQWYYDQNSNNPVHIGPNYVTPPLGTTTIFWADFYTPADGCHSPKVPVKATVIQPPQMFVDVSDRTVEIPNANVEFTGGSNQNITSWFYDFGDGTTSTSANPVHQYVSAGNYTVTVTAVNDYGCESTIYYTIDVSQDIHIVIPSAFTPNGDGVNDEFFIGHTLITDFNMLVFDRWGKVVYETDNKNFAWDGKDKNGVDLPEGVYVYVVTATGYDGYEIKKSGSITLIR